ncbi:MoaF-related domain-containing protein [Sinorhizobium psoraleae]|uniref:MoaF-like domain-containing protein n=1 Tax=Sinorhizobium psoraleae TaxID=520838 RepID=A0ABT4KPW2_9HYPH|nr:hypothetical protein [Sinorhizobium psoraleae]MCZ4093879.1 hypothetical protein [Sinorhizobium psoraleae]
MTANNVQAIREGSILSYEWTEGGFTGNVYEVTLLPKGKLTWRGLEGSRSGQSAIEDQVTVREVAPGVTQVAWLESVGYTVNLIIVPGEGRVFGLVTNGTEFYPHAGKLREVR